MVVAVNLVRVRAKRAAHDQFDAFTAGLAHIGGVVEGDQAVHVGGQVIEKGSVYKLYAWTCDGGCEASPG